MPSRPGIGPARDVLIDLAQFLVRPSRHADALALDHTRKLLLLGLLLATDLAVSWLVLDPLGAFLAQNAGADPEVLGSWDIAWPGGATLLLWAVVEETAFRLWLRPSAVNVAAAAALLILLLSGDWSGHTLLRMGGAMAAALLVPAGLYGRLRRHATGAMVHASALIFALAHLMNFDAPASPALALALLPQWFMGYLFAYARLRLGFGWAISLHALHNWLAFLLEAG